MSEFKSSAGYTSTTGGGDDGGLFMVHTPVWCTVVRGFQAFFGFLILILAGLLIHGLALDAVVFALVCGLFSMIIVTYALVSEKAPNCRNAYNIWAILALDLFMAILWLSSMGANAALRATFVVDVNADCWDDGSAVNAGHCVVSRRNDGLSKRVIAVATQAGLAQLSAVAGLSALEMLLFIATLVYNGHAFRMHHQEKSGGSGDAGHMEMKGQSDSPPRQPSHQELYSDQNQYASQVYQQQHPQQQQQEQQQPYDPSYYDQKPQASAYAVAAQPPQPTYGGGGAYSHDTSDQYQQQPMYSPHGTPAPQHTVYQPPH